MPRKMVVLSSAAMLLGAGAYGYWLYRKPPVVLWNFQSNITLVKRDGKDTCIAQGFDDKGYVRWGHMECPKPPAPAPAEVKPVVPQHEKDLAAPKGK